MNPEDLASHQYGAGLFLMLMLLSLAAPPAILCLRYHQWRFGVRHLMAATLFLAFCLYFGAGDLSRIDLLVRECWHYPPMVFWLVKVFLLPCGLAAIISNVLTMCACEIYRLRSKSTSQSVTHDRGE